MIQYLLRMKRSRRSMIDPLPIDFGCMYFLYPTESGYIEGFRTTGLRGKLAKKIKGFFKHDDESQAYGPESIY